MHLDMQSLYSLPLSAANALTGARPAAAAAAAASALRLGRATGGTGGLLHCGTDEGTSSAGATVSAKPIIAGRHENKRGGQAQVSAPELPPALARRHKRRKNFIHGLRCAKKEFYTFPLLATNSLARHEERIRERAILQRLKSL